jgi:hypothetical protein
MIDCRSLLIAGLAFAAFASVPASAHHGWRWAEGENSIVEGTIVEVSLGNPHGVVMLETAAGEVWEVEVGQPWRNEGAGLTDDLLQPGVEMRAEGHRSADPAERVFKAERVGIGGMLYNLYPDRN